MNSIAPAQRLLYIYNNGCLIGASLQQECTLFSTFITEGLKMQQQAAGRCVVLAETSTLPAAGARRRRDRTRLASPPWGHHWQPALSGAPAGAWTSCRSIPWLGLGWWRRWRWRRRRWRWRGCKPRPAAAVKRHSAGRGHRLARSSAPAAPPSLPTAPPTCVPACNGRRRRQFLKPLLWGQGASPVLLRSQVQQLQRANRPAAAHLPASSCDVGTCAGFSTATPTDCSPAASARQGQRPGPQLRPPPLPAAAATAAAAQAVLSGSAVVHYSVSGRRERQRQHIFLPAAAAPPRPTCSSSVVLGPPPPAATSCGRHRRTASAVNTGSSSPHSSCNRIASHPLVLPCCPPERCLPSASQRSHHLRQQKMQGRQPHMDASPSCSMCSGSSSSAAPTSSHLVLPTLTAPMGVSPATAAGSDLPATPCQIACQQSQPCSIRHPAPDWMHQPRPRARLCRHAAGRRFRSQPWCASRSRRGTSTVTSADHQAGDRAPLAGRSSSDSHIHTGCHAARKQKQRQQRHAGSRKDKQNWWPPPLGARRGRCQVWGSSVHAVHLAAGLHPLLSTLPPARHNAGRQAAAALCERQAHAAFIIGSSSSSSAHRCTSDSCGGTHRARSSAGLSANVFFTQVATWTAAAAAAAVGGRVGGGRRDVQQHRYTTTMGQPHTSPQPPPTAPAPPPPPAPPTHPLACGSGAPGCARCGWAASRPGPAQRGRKAGREAATQAQQQQARGSAEHCPRSEQHVPPTHKRTCPQTSVFSSTTPCVQASRSTGRLQGPRGVLMRSLHGGTAIVVCGGGAETLPARPPAAPAARRFCMQRPPHHLQLSRAPVIPDVACSGGAHIVHDLAVIKCALARLEGWRRLLLFSCGHLLLALGGPGLAPGRCLRVGHGCYSLRHGDWPPGATSRLWQCNAANESRRWSERRWRDGDNFSTACCEHSCLGLIGLFLTVILRRSRSAPNAATPFYMQARRCHNLVRTATAHPPPHRPAARLPAAVQFLWPDRCLLSVLCVSAIVGRERIERETSGPYIHQWPLPV